MMRAFLFFIMMSISAASAAAEITNMRVGDHGHKTRLVVDLSGEMDFQATILDNPYRLVIHTHKKDISLPEGFKLKEPFTSYDIQNPQNDLTRIEAALNNPYIIQSAFMIADDKGDSNRLVIDLKPTTEEVFSQNSQAVHGPLIVDASGLKSKISENKKPIIVIDAGHGGYDSGAVAFNGLLEKNVTLSVATLLADELNKSGEYEAYLTRESDIFIPLYDRVKMARAAGANLFLSIHADSLRDSRLTQGASVYTLSNVASDEQTEKLAIRENLADKIGGIDIQADEGTAAILMDLSMRATLNDSLKLAESIVKNFQTNDVATLMDAHRQGGFAVLRAPDIPAALIEIGFISNADEAKKLSSSDYQSTIGKAIKQALDEYFDAQ